MKVKTSIKDFILSTLPKQLDTTGLSRFKQTFTITENGVKVKRTIDGYFDKTGTFIPKPKEQIRPMTANQIMWKAYRELEKSDSNKHDQQSISVMLSKLTSAGLISRQSVTRPVCDKRTRFEYFVKV